MTSTGDPAPASSPLVRFTNVRLLRDHRLCAPGIDLWVRNGRIVDPERVFFDERRHADRTVDCGGRICAAGFIDLQINGGWGVDFSDATADISAGLTRVACGILAHGVTAFCPTLVTSPPETYHRVLPLLAKRRGGRELGAAVLGTHLEGPFISAEKKGAHPERCIREFDTADVEGSLRSVYGDVGLQHVSIVTMAPEKPNALRAIAELTGRGVCVSLGHSMANLQEGEAAVRSGSRLITHLFNAMLPFHHRDPGLVGLLTSDSLPAGQIVYFGIIADGFHTHPSALRIAYRSHPDGLCLVTDAIAGLGFSDGVHRLGQLEIEIRQGRGFLRGTETLCGSIAPLAECVRKFRLATGCSVEYALEAASLHPARALGIEARKGSLHFGADADFVLLDDDLNVQSTWIAGECVYDIALL